MNKNRIRRVVAAVMVSVMMMGMTVFASAATSTHECAFSYMGNVHRGTTHAYSHGYTTYDLETGQPVYNTCEVVAEQYMQVWKCACGATQYRIIPSVMRHTSNCSSN